jgi:hypothetical protein
VPHSSNDDREAIPVILAVDVEPDDLTLDPGSPCGWSGFEAAFAWLTSIRPELEDRTGAPVHYSWTLRIDPQIAHVYGRAAWLADRYSREWDAALRAGDEIGMHPHFHRWDPRSATWRLDFTDRASIDDGLLRGLETFESAFGRRCRTTHLGGWVNERLLAVLDRSGVEFDLSVRPDLHRTRVSAAGTVVRGRLPATVGAPHVPYRPSRSDFRRAAGTDRLDLTLVPLTVAPLALTAGAADVARRAKHLVRSGFRFVRPRVLLTLTDAWRHPNSFAALLDRALEWGGRHLAFVNRSDFARDRLANTRHALDVLLNHPRRRVAFTTPAGALASLRVAHDTPVTVAR